MKTFTESDDLEGAEFVGANLRGARFVESDLSGLVMRGVEIARADVDAPWLTHGDFFRVNGVDVTAYVEAELDKRFPGRELRRAPDPEGLRAAYAAVQDTWAATLERAARLPDGAVDESVGGEWSFAQTLRHLVHATDMWLGKAALELEQPFHPLGLRYAADPSGETSPPYSEVLAVRAERVAQVRDFLATVTPAQLDERRRNPHNPDHPETVRRCLHVIIEEEWEHHRFAVRDLDALEAGPGGSDGDSLSSQP